MPSPPPRFGAFARQCQDCRRPLLDEDPPGAQQCSRQICVTQRRMREAAQNAKAVRSKRDALFEATWQRAEPAINAAKQRLSTAAPEHIASEVSPYIELPIIPLPAARHAEFVSHLNTVINESFDEHPEEDGPPEPPEKDPDYTQRLHDEGPELAILDTACIACQGDCCLQGRKTHAFLTKDTINYIRWSHPDMPRDEIAEMYLSRLPDKSVLESCVFHGDKGCVLNREIRADICNSFQCGFRKRLANAYAANPGNGAVVAGIATDHTEHPEAGAPYMRLVSMSEDGDVTIHDDIPMPALPQDQA